MTKCPAVLLLFAWSLGAAEFPVAAQGDGVTVVTAAIQQAIDAAARAGAGSVVTFRPGTYVTGSLFLKSGVHFRVDAGVTLRGAQDPAAYPVMQSRIAGVEMQWPAALLNVYEQSNVKISGKGTIDGDGRMWWDLYWRMRRDDYDPKGLRWAVDYDCRRPRLIQVYRASKVDLEGLTLQRSAFWTVHICYSDHVRVDRVTIRNNVGGHGPSTDGIDIDSSSNVLVRRCDIDCNDDAICLKSGRDADGLRVNRPSEKIRIIQNIVRGGAAGVTVGSETSGGIRDVVVDRLTVLEAVPNGVLFKSTGTRGGTMENISVRRVYMKNVATPFSVALNWNPAYSNATIPAGMTNVPDYWKVLTAPVSREQGLPHFRNIRVSQVLAEGAKQAFSVAAYPEAPLRDFEFREVKIQAKTAGGIRNAGHWTFRKVLVETADGSRVSVKDSTGVTGLPQ